MPMPASAIRLGRYVNPVVNRLAPHVPPLAVMHHVGRSSGAAYSTPVQAYRTERGWVVALAFGPDVDWLRNVEAAAGGELVRRGRRHLLSEPRRLRGSAGARLLPWWARGLMGVARVREYVEFTADESAA